MSMLQPSCLSLLAQMMATVMDALRAGKGAVHLQTDDVQLSPHVSQTGELGGRGRVDNEVEID